MKKTLNIMIILSCLIAPVSSGTETRSLITETPMITALLERLGTGFNETDYEQVMQQFSSRDPEFYTRMEHRYGSLFAAENPAARLQVQSIDTSKTPIEVLAFIETSQDNWGRRFGSAFWVTFQVENTENGWRITGEEVRDYAKPRHIDMTVELFPERGEMQGNATIRYEIVEPGETSLVMSLNRGIDITDLRDGEGRPLEIRRTGRLAMIDFGREFPPGATGELKVAFHGTLFNESSERGFSQVAITPMGSFASWVTSWYPMLNCETTKCPGNLTFIVPEGITVVSSGLKSGEDTSDGRTTYRFAVS
ncbi:MAG TPA: hypothetical protein PLV45_15485, partial [bacterium]|nr:hypothetical protein [bacterium]